MTSLTRVSIATLHDATDQECPICIERYVPTGRSATVAGTLGNDETESFELLPGAGEDSPVRLPCGHVVGEACIRQWLSTNPASYPICRMQF